MANSESNCVFVKTNLNTRFIVLVYNDENISCFKENLCKEHKLCFPQFGEITISALEVEREGLFYHLPDSLILSKAFYGISKKNWFLRVDVLGVQEDMVTITPADQTCPNPHLLEEKTEITKDLTLAQVAEEQEIIKRNMESMDTKRSQKKSSIDLNQSANATELCATEKDVHHMDKVKDVQANQTVKKDLSDLQKGVKKDLAPALQLGDGVNESHEVRGEDCVKDNPDDFLMKPITKDIKIWERIEVGEGSKSVTIAGNNRQVADSNSSLTTAVANEKKRKRTKRDTKQPTDVAKENGEMDAVDAKSVKKKKSRKAKTLAQEDTLVASAGQNVNEDTLVACEAMKATDI